MTKPLVIYHGNCADGFGAAWVFWSKYGAAYEYHAGVYNETPPPVKGRDVYLVDFSYKRPFVEEMIKVANKVVLLDHHKSALIDLCALEGLEQSHSNLECSGAMLAWRYHHADATPPALLTHIQDRDLWHFKLARTREIQANLFSYPYDFEVWDKLMKMTKEELTAFADGGMSIERKHFKDIEELLKVTQRTMVIGEYTVPVAGLPYTLVSDAAAAMALNAPFAACYWDTPTRRKFGLRSSATGIDVSVIASQYGGGGHARAAGFEVPRDHYLATN